MTNELQQMAIAALGRDAARAAVEFEGRWITWDEIQTLAATLHGLLDATCIRDDAPVALLARYRPWAIAAMLTLLARGCNLQMIYTMQSPTGIVRDLDRLQPAALVAESVDFSAIVNEALSRLSIAGIALDAMTARSVAPQTTNAATRSRAGPVERQVEIFTSGTTGPPKQFALTHTLIARHIVAPSRIFALPDHAAATAIPQLLFFPIGNISGLYSTLPTILKGQRAILLDRFSLAAWREFVLRYRPALSGIPPSFYRVLLDADIPPIDLASIKAMGAGAAPLDPDVQQEFEEKYGIPILLSYGATEFGGPVTAMTLEDRAQYGGAKLGSVGKPIPGARLRVIDPDSGDVLPANSEGLLEVVSPRIGSDWIRTTDMGMIDEDGFVFHRGRADGAIMRGGFKILPETIEAALKRHPLVSEAVVVGIPDNRLGEAPAAAVQLTPDATGVDEQALEAHLRELVMKTHLPVKWLFCTELPRTVSAKLDRNSVKKLFLD